MMYCKQGNDQLASQLRLAFKTSFHYKDEVYEDIFSSFDSDKVQYKIVANKDIVLFMFSCLDFNSLWAFVASYFQQKYFPDLKITVPGQGGFSLMITIDQSSLKQSSEDQVSLRLSKFKRNFFAAPYEMMMIAIKEKKQLGNLSFCPRPGDKTWISFDSTRCLTKRTSSQSTMASPSRRNQSNSSPRCCSPS